MEIPREWQCATCYGQRYRAFHINERKSHIARNSATEFCAKDLSTRQIMTQRDDTPQWRRIFSLCKPKGKLWTYKQARITNPRNQLVFVFFYFCVLSRVYIIRILYRIFNWEPVAFFAPKGKGAINSLAIANRFLRSCKQRYVTGVFVVFTYFSLLPVPRYETSVHVWHSLVAHDHWSVNYSSL